MADTLSTVANAAAIVGRADVSFRAAKELYVFFSAVKGASKEVKSLQNELQDINTILRLLSENGGSPHSFRESDVIVTSLPQSLHDFRNRMG
jgi:hypothetical protein